MTREKILQIVQELFSVLNEKKVTPQEAEVIGSIFERNIRAKNEEEKGKYMTKATFSGNSPKE